MKTRYLLFLLMTAVVAAMSACSSTETNVNVRPANTAVVNKPATPTMAPTVDCNNTNMTREEYDKNKTQCENQKGSSTIGQGVNDSWIWFKTRAALMTTSDLRESTINVDVVNDVITLKGTVANAAQKASAEKVAKSIEGQKGVKNELKVAPNDSMTNTNTHSNSNSTMNKNTMKK